MHPRRGVRAAFAALGVFLLALVGLQQGARLAHPAALFSDEPEWIAISILHWRQFALGEPPAGAERDPPAERHGSPWRRGVQRSTFGYMYPTFPKLVLGGTLFAAGHREAAPEVFTIFGRGDPARMQAERVALLPAMPLARRVVLVTAALACACFVLAVRGLRAGTAGWIPAGLAGVLLLASPLVRDSSTYIRTDWFMLAAGMAALWSALAWRAELSGAHGRARQLAATAGLGLLSGLAVASKLNGAMVGMCVALWIPLCWLERSERRSAAEFLRGPLRDCALAGGVCAIVFYAFSPRLWSEPFSGVNDILARWDDLMRYFQDQVAPNDGVAVPRSLSERLTLFLERTTGRDDAWRALSGLPGGALLAALGLAALGWRARGLGSGDDDALPAALALAFCAVTLGVTALWIPLDWERFFLTAAPAMALLQAWGLWSLGELVAQRVRGRARSAGTATEGR